MELTALRRQLLVAGSRFELEHLLYKVDKFLTATLVILARRDC